MVHYYEASRPSKGMVLQHCLPQWKNQFSLLKKQVKSFWRCKLCMMSGFPDISENLNHPNSKLLGVNLLVNCIKMYQPSKWKYHFIHNFWVTLVTSRMPQNISTVQDEQWPICHTERKNSCNSYLQICWLPIMQQDCSEHLLTLLKDEDAEPTS
jgi:hypothetical protein